MLKFAYYLTIFLTAAWTATLLIDKYALGESRAEISWDLSHVAIGFALASWLRWEVEKEKAKAQSQAARDCKPTDGTRERPRSALGPLHDPRLPLRSLRLRGENDPFSVPSFDR